ncbi:Alpha-galactosidase [Oceanobacillus picturae]|uniref:Alpha-galactosidase n=2 Tax=Oceanobacillus picturae TaxID=171693 RepID=W9ALE7_9BACI|nr:Alpha-galactosidase [Oceanobacillus picturae]
MMMITIDDNRKQFHLTNGKISYLFHVMKNGQLGHLYYGKAIKTAGHIADFQRYNIPTPNTTHLEANDPAFTMETTRQEFPVFGATDFREPALSILQDNGSHISNFVFDSYRVVKGKPMLEGLPATYVTSEEEAETIEITLYDAVTDMELLLSYTIFKNVAVITRHARVTNRGEATLTLDRLLSGSIDFPHADFAMLQLSGAWSRERHLQERKLESGIQSISSLRGSSSHSQNPFLALKETDATEFTGDVYGFNLVYSSNFLAQVEVDHYEQTRVSMGIHPFGFQWKLEPGESFQAPEVVMAFSSNGLNGLSKQFHNVYRNHLINQKWLDAPRPVMLNNWEATYHDFNEEIILAIAKEAVDLDLDLFVLDDGWFGKRNSDTTSLGDWFVNKEKLPNGLGKLAQDIRDLGLDFGLWFEPEMVSPDSDLYREHPDWVVKTPGRSASYGRNQWVLDFSNKEVVAYLYERMRALIEETQLSYIKWDMNRNITEAYSSTLPAAQQGEFYHRYILGVYQLYENLTSKFPDVLFESCAGGGGRFDPGMLYYAPQGWISDNTDPVERLHIQYGTSIAYPISSFGTHVSATPNHQTGRTTSLSFRAHVALFGTFGYELNPLGFSAEEKVEIRKQVALYKQHQHLMLTGDFIRLKNPADGNEAAWMMVNETGEEALVSHYRILAESNPGKMKFLRLKGLESDAYYRCQDTEGVVRHYYGSELMYRGIPLKGEFNGANGELSIPMQIGDFQSEIFYISKEEGEV